MNMKIKRIIGMLLTAAMLSGCFISLNAFAADAVVSIAEFKYAADSTAVNGGELSSYGNMDSGYSATGGILMSSAKLSATVDGTNARKLEWSKPEYEYNGVTESRAPLMTAGKKNPWGDSPYFLIHCSTKGYENITFSAKVSGSNKGPANYRLEYSTDGKTYTTVRTAPAITVNKVLNSNLFDSVSVPAAADSADVYFKIAAVNTTAINGNDLSVEPTSGEAAINDIIISGTAKGIKPKLSAPSASAASGSEIYYDTKIALTNSVSGAVIKYSVNGGAEQLYTSPFSPFEGSSAETATVRAYAESDGYETSPEAVFTYTCTKDNITTFAFADQSSVKYVNGSVEAVSGVYPNGRLTASLDGVRKYVPLYDSEKGASLTIAPDDAYTWHNGGYWQFELCTEGYYDLYLSMDAYSSNKGPASMQLYCSTDGVNFTPWGEPKDLSQSSFGTYYSGQELPSELADKKKVYVRLVMNEDRRANPEDSAPLFENESKGNTAINNVVFSGTRTAVLKTPYTTKKTEYFGLNGTISYNSPDNAVMKYSIYDKNGNAVTDNAYYDSVQKISLAALPQFDAEKNNSFRVDIWAEKDGQKSGVNSKTYVYKGGLITCFKFDETSAGGQTVSPSAGSGTLSMYPDGINKAELAYHLNSDTLRASASAETPWNFDTARVNPNGDGYWLVETATKGYENLTFSADMYSTDNGPRDFAISYSTDGVNFTALPDSTVRMTADRETVYSNISLPKELNNKEKIYLKIKIDGGETLLGTDLDDITVIGKGNTGINNIELCGTVMKDGIYLDTDDIKLVKGKSYAVDYVCSAENPVVIAAFYSGNTLINLQRNVSEITVPAGSNITEVRIMLWSDLLMLRPLSEAVTKAVTD